MCSIWVARRDGEVMSDRWNKELRRRAKGKEVVQEMASGDSRTRTEHAICRPAEDFGGHMAAVED